MDFMTTKVTKLNSPNRAYDFLVEPDFINGHVKDLVVKGGKFYAFWNGGKWDTEMNHLIQSIDSKTGEKVNKIKAEDDRLIVASKYVKYHSSGVMAELSKYLKTATTIDAQFNVKILFSDSPSVREDYSTNKLSFTPTEGDSPAFDELMGVLYSDEELDKIKWFIGALYTNNMPKIQKFMFLYGGKGSGKGTVINIFKKLFDGYHASIDLALLTSNSEFATGQVQEVPLLIDEDTDISRIAKDTNLLKLTAHEPLNINEKYKERYSAVFTGLLITASNQRFKVRNVDSGITRRAVTVEPTNEKVSRETYTRLYNQINYELPMIAYKCMEHFTKMGASYYDDYIAVDMMEATDLVFSFVREHATTLGDNPTLKQAAELYKIYLDEMDFDTTGYKRKIKQELSRYYNNFYADKQIESERYKNVFVGFKRELVFPEEIDKKIEIVEFQTGIKEQDSLLDDNLADCPAQIANEFGVPSESWDDCTTTLSDINTRELHYVRPPLNHIIIDFDIKDSEGNKDLDANIAASKDFPETYMELSKSGGGLHLHYIYDGDVARLDPIYDTDIEVKAFKGKSSIRRLLTKCNNKPIRHISTGLPIKKEVDDLNEQVDIIAWNEKKMRTSIKKNIAKEYHAATKPSIDFIKSIFEQADRTGVKYDLTDMRPRIMAFAMQSTHNSQYCAKVVSQIKYCNIEEEHINEISKTPNAIIDDSEITFYDVEVFKNLFVVVYKKYKQKAVRWINPTPEQMGELLRMNLVGFFNRGYDNHIICARWNGETNEQLFERSQKIVNGKDRWEGQIRTANEMSYADIYEYSADKKSLKKWEIELKIHHDELEIPWDQEVPEHLWDRVGEYCENDVIATEAVFESTYPDYLARKILATLSGLSINSTNKQHAEAFLFGDDPNPQEKFAYTDLSKEFPGYKFDPYASNGHKSDYYGEDPSEGGYVYSEPGVYTNVALLDVESMHPNSAINLNYFGPYTQKYKDLLQTRVYIKHEDFDKAGEMFGGVLKPFLTDEHSAKALSTALKIVINIVYGLSSASFPNKFKHKDNIDNIIAKRGALFMINLRKAVQEQGFTVAHVKTDSIKIPDATPEIIDFVFSYGAEYGYVFDHEHTYDRMALVNKSVYIAEYEDEETGKKVWEPTGAQFADPIVLKTLFTWEPISEDDYAITKSAKSPIYLGDQFIGKVVRVYASLSGEDLVKDNKGKWDSVTGAKGYKWRLMSDYKGKEDIDMSYYDKLIVDAITAIDGVGSAFKIIDDVPDKFMDHMLPF